jgi:predicted TIM-barrel fold metal-dependent hydrolase
MTERPPFVDTHVHFHDMAQTHMRWVWLEPGWVHPILGDIGALQSQRYTAADFVATTRFQNVAKAVHIQAALGSDDPVDETVWLQAAFESTGFPTAIVAEVALDAPDAEAVIERHLAASPNIRGVRHFGPEGYYTDPTWQKGFALLGKHDLVCSLDSMPEVYADALELARSSPETTMCVDHTGFPRERGDEYFAFWKRELTKVGQAENAVIKVSGLGMLDPTWTVDSIRPWFETAVEIFGPERTVLGTNWPVDSMTSSYGDILDAYWEILQQYGEAERIGIWSGNAERIFRI